jgi:hypothetical protein
MRRCGWIYERRASYRPLARRERPIRALKIRSKGSRFFQHAISSTRRERPIEATVALALALSTDNAIAIGDGRGAPINRGMQI